MSQTILVADDSKPILDLLRRNLCARGFSCILAEDGQEALRLAKESRPDLVLLDVEMPGLDGFGVCRRLKRAAATRGIPVIIMSGARIKDRDVVHGFLRGADDYVLKPFAMEIVRARIAAVLRRYRPPRKAEQCLARCGIKLDPAGRSVQVGRKPLPLTRKEFDLLSTLVGKPDKVMSIRFLLKTVWGYDPDDYSDPATVEVHVSHLRKKLGPKVGKRIVSVVGHGYKFSS